jgi:hypothetical protein
VALDKDILGAALNARRNAFSDQTMDELIASYGDLPGVRLAMAIADADEIIKHIQTFGIVHTAGTALAQTGTMS